MKVLLLNGSPRTEGNTNLALNEIAKQLEKNDIETQIMQIGTKSVRGCIVCGRCGELGRCVFDDDLCNRVAEKIALCDALVVGSPVYWGQPNGTLMSLLQRMLYSQGNVVANKPVAAVCVCRRGGSTMAAQTLLMPFHLMNCPIVTSQYWPVVFGRAEGEAALDGEGMQTMRTLADNMALIDDDLAQTAVNFWDLTWNDSRRHLPYETRLLLSLANAVGAGRMRQATRELVKAYIHGLDSAALDDVFELLAWNQGIGYFSSEIGPSTLFQAYKTIKQMEKKGNSRAEIIEVLKEKFTEKNPDIKLM